MPILPPVDPELELQRKILDIMNKPSITTSGAMAAVAPVSSNAALEALQAVSTASASASSSTVSSTSGLGAGANLLADPKVQKALDSLLSGNMFF